MMMLIVMMTMMPMGREVQKLPELFRVQWLHTENLIVRGKKLHASSLSTSRKLKVSVHWLYKRACPA
jgi:hypothetical protein